MPGELAVLGTELDSLMFLSYKDEIKGDFHCFSFLLILN